MKKLLLAAVLVLAGLNNSPVHAGNSFQNGGGFNPCTTIANCGPNGGTINCTPTNPCIPVNGGNLCTLPNQCLNGGVVNGGTNNGGTPGTVDEPATLQLLGILAVAGLGFFLRRRK